MQALLLRWVEEQEVGGLQTFEKAKAALIELKVSQCFGVSGVFRALATAAWEGRYMNAEVGPLRAQVPGIAC